MAETFRRVVLTQALLDVAFQRASLLPIFDYSHRKFEANYVGCIGEVVFERFLDHHRICYRDDTSSTERDYVIDDEFTVDVKTKDRTVLPRADYDNTVPLYNHEHQRPDFYYFISLLRDTTAEANDPYRFSVACLLGGISLADLDRVGTRWKAGQVDPRNGTKFWTSCINVPMTELLSNDDFLACLRSRASR